MHVFERSGYTRARLNLLKTAAVAAALGGGALLAWRRARPS